MKADDSLEPRLYNILMTAKVLSVSTSTVRRLIQRGELKATRIGDRVLISPAAIDDLISGAS